MKNRLFSVLSLLLAASSALATEQGSGTEDFLPGRIISRGEGRAILAKCALRDSRSECVGFQFYYSPSGKEADAEAILSEPNPYAVNEDGEPSGLMIQSLYTEYDIEVLKKNPSFFNLLSEETANSPRWIKITGAAIGVTLGLPASATNALIALVYNVKINKLLRAVRKGEEVKMNDATLERLRNGL